MLNRTGAFVRFVAGLLPAVSLVACGGGGGSNGPQQTASAPTITTHPQSAVVDGGASATFTVVATGTATLTYQWLRDGTAIAGANQATYQLSEAMAADNNAVFVARVSNSAGTTTSSSATLTVYSGAPVIHSNPTDQSTTAGNTMALTVVAHGTLPLRFQWRKYGIDIPAATSASYMTPPLSPGDSGAAFDVVVTNDFGSAVSASASIAVSAVPGAVSVSSQPQPLSITEGSIASFSVAAAGTGPFNYQWRRNGAAIAGAYDSTYRFTASRLNHGDQYSVDVANATGLATSDPAGLSVSTGAISLQLGALGGVGNTSGTADQARFSCPTGVVGDAAGNLYVASHFSGAVRRISPTQDVSTFAGSEYFIGATDGVGTSARFSSPSGIAIDSSGNLYVTDGRNQTIRKISPIGEVSTIAGTVGSAGTADGVGSTAQFNFAAPSFPECDLAGIAVDTAGNLYVADTLNHTIRRVTAAGIVTTLAGSPGQAAFADGTGAQARFDHPRGIALDAQGNVLVADGHNARVRKIDAAGNVTSLSKAFSVDNTMGGAKGITGIAVDNTGRTYVTEGTGYIWRSDANGEKFAVIAGRPCGRSCVPDGIGAGARFIDPKGLYVNSIGDLFISDEASIRRTRPDSRVSTVAGRSRFDPSLPIGQTAAHLISFSTADIAVDSAGNVFAPYSYAIVKITPAGTLSVFAGSPSQSGAIDGAGTDARFVAPSFFAMDSANNLYVADPGLHTVRKISAGGTVTTIAGTANQAGSADGQGAAARFNSPQGIAVDSLGNVYVADHDNQTIRKISATGAVTTLAGAVGVYGATDGTGSNARFANPRRLAVDNSGNVFVVEEYFLSPIRRISPAGVVTTIGSFGSTPTDGTSATAAFSRAEGIAADTSGNVYVTDSNTLRKISAGGNVTTVAGLPQSQGVLLGALPGSLNFPQAVVKAPSTTGVKLLVVSEGALLSVTLP